METVDLLLIWLIKNLAIRDMAEDLSWSPENVNFLVEVLGISDTCHHSDECQILTITDTLRSFDCWRLLMGSGKSEVGRRPFNAFDVHGRTRICIINAGLQDLIIGCTTSCQLSHWSAISLSGRIPCLFESRRHTD